MYTAHIVKPNELVSIYPIDNEDGREEYVVIDKTSIKNMFPSVPEMRVLRTVPSSCIPFHYLQGSHYFVNVKKTKKNRKMVENPEDLFMYDMVHSGLVTKNEVLVVRYTSMNTNKYAVIFPAKCGLRLCNLIASNYQKKRRERQPIGQETSRIKLYNRLVKGTRQADLKVNDFKDDYGKKLEELVDATISGQEIEQEEESEVPVIARLVALEHDSSEENSSEDEQESPVQKINKRVRIPE